MFRKALMGLTAGLALLSGHAAGQDEGAVPGVAEAIYPDAIWAKGVAPLETEAELQTLITRAMSGELADVMGETRQIVVIHGGRLVAESYRESFEPDTKLVSWSMAKSITQALVGRAVQDGLIADIDAPMPGPWEQGDPRADITWRQWMTMTDGLEYYEVGEADLAKNDVVQMMFGPGRFDVVDYVKDLPQIHEAGAHWNYSTAGYHSISKALLVSVLEASTGVRAVAGEEGTHCYDVYQEHAASLQETLAAERALQEGRNIVSSGRRHLSNRELFKCAYAQGVSETLFSPLGMDAQPEFDAAGTFLGGSLVYASARDFARFGYLYLRDGVWKGERLLPQGWVDFATTAHEGTDTNVYGAGWWITPEEGETPTHDQSAISAPYDAFHAGGNEGQTIWVVPSKDLVIVRLGLMSNAPENWAALYEWNQEVARAFPDAQ